MKFLAPKLVALQMGSKEKCDFLKNYQNNIDYNSLNN
jgi:hypothetical protein